MNPFEFYRNLSKHRRVGLVIVTIIVIASVIEFSFLYIERFTIRDVVKLQIIDCRLHQSREGYRIELTTENDTYYLEEVTWIDFYETDYILNGLINERNFTVWLSPTRHNYIDGILTNKISIPPESTIRRRGALKPFELFLLCVFGVVGMILFLNKRN